MIPILLFFGLCFFGFGDCQDEPNIVSEENIIRISNSSNQTGLADSYTTTYRIGFDSYLAQMVKEEQEYYDDNIKPLKKQLEDELKELEEVNTKQRNPASNEQKENEN